MGEQGNRGPQNKFRGPPIAKGPNSIFKPGGAPFRGGAGGFRGTFIPRGASRGGARVFTPRGTSS